MSISDRSPFVTIDNTDDYLAPSQACVNPAFQPPPKKFADGISGTSSNKNGTTNTKTDQTKFIGGVVPRRRRRLVKKHIGSSDTIIFPDTQLKSSSRITISADDLNATQPEEKKENIVKASMADCLACSGCVTTAETVMMEERHSLKSLRNRLIASSSSLNGNQQPHRVVTVSPNSWSDICRHWDLTNEDIIANDNNDGSGGNYTNREQTNFYFSRFTTLLSRILSVRIVIDGNVPLQWTWIDEAKEFCQIFQQNQKNAAKIKGGATIANDSPLRPSIAVDASTTLYYNSDGTTVTCDNDKASTPNLPLISGSCPATVCLVEKTLTQLVPHLSQTISPMSMVGMILKNNNDNNDNNNDNINWDHWAIMPCHDKKLEASRKDFLIQKNSKEQAVDLVISTQECVELVEEWIVTQGNIDTSSEDQQQQCPSTKNRIVRYLESLPASDVVTNILEPKDLLKQSLYATDNPTALLLTTPVIHQHGNDEIGLKSTATVSLQKQIAFSSGGHANFIFNFAAKHLFGCTLDDGGIWKIASLGMKNIRSARLGKMLKQHYYEAKLFQHADGSFSTDPLVADDVNRVSPSLESKESHVVLHFAIAYGMQTMQRALKQITEKSIDDNSFHYLEAQACPHGCVNGGGSARTKSNISKASSTLRETPSETKQRVKSTLKYLKVLNIDKLSATSTKLQSPWLVKECPRTVYHVVPSMLHTTGAVAGEKVENMIW